MKRPSFRADVPIGLTYADWSWKRTPAGNPGTGTFRISHTLLDARVVNWSSTWKLLCIVISICQPGNSGLQVGWIYGSTDLDRPDDARDGGITDK